MANDPGMYVAGVPVKISERYRPPRRITLPASCHHQIDPELLTQEYDFAVEKETLNWIEKRRLNKEKEASERKARIEQYEKEKAEKIEREEKRQQMLQEEEKRQKKVIEEEMKKQEEEKRNEKEKIEEERKEQKREIEDEEKDNEVANMNNNNINNNSESDEGEVIEDRFKNENNEKSAELQKETHSVFGGSVSVISNKSSNNNSKCQANKNTNSYIDMLKPTPFPSRKADDGSNMGSFAQINFADFEGEANDPFDSAALKSINDMEELAKVLQSSNVSSQSTDQDSKDISQNLYPNGQSVYHVDRSREFYHQQQPLPQSTMASHGTSASFGQYGNTSVITCCPSQTSSSAVSAYSGVHYRSGGANNYRGVYYSQNWNGGYQNSPNRSTTQYNQYPYRYPGLNSSSNIHSVTTPSMTKSQASDISSNPCAPDSPQAQARGSVPQQNLVRSGPSLEKQQELEEFYSRYYPYSNTLGSPGQSGQRSGEVTPSQNSTSHSQQGMLRSSRSVPDLTATDDIEVSQLSGNQSPTLGRIISHTPPPRPSSTGPNGLENWKPLPVLPGSPGRTVNKPSENVEPPSLSQKTRLPDPFIELNHEAQVLVQSVAEMGFPRPRVARAVQKLGVDHKKLIEVLLALQSLQDSGEDEYRAEFAFYHYLGDLEKTKEHLTAVKQLLDLGFEEEKIIQTLVNNDNDRDKALEELIS
ncbi:uncharacterized protein LOC143029589 [Oratosquilla oratoria]|uniref:uncharacterized protein LOC143029589 n=1 Tax=Oratosquilla oratoria TaxID=337810 RepID=UPI003F76CE1F